MKRSFNEIPDFEEDVILALKSERDGLQYILCPAFYYENFRSSERFISLVHTPTGRIEVFEEPVWWCYAKELCDFYNENAE